MTAAEWSESVSRLRRFRSARSSPALWQRSSRSFSSALLMISSSLAGISAFNRTEGASNCSQEYSHIYPYVVVWVDEIERRGPAAGDFLQDGVAPVESRQAARARRAAGHGHGDSPHRARQ